MSNELKKIDIADIMINITKMRGTNLFSYLMETFRPQSKVDQRYTYLHTCVIVSRGKIIAGATNRIGARARALRKGERYTHNTHGPCTVHAEIAALRCLGDLNKLRGADMYVWRLSPSVGKPSNSAPCSECRCVLEKCMREYDLRRVYYSTV
jgi:Cytidine and deoxycytidylate deaminase zinc-binding region